MEAPKSRAEGATFSLGGGRGAGNGSSSSSSSSSAAAVRVKREPAQSPPRGAKDEEGAIFFGDNDPALDVGTGGAKSMKKTAAKSMKMDGAGGLGLGGDPFGDDDDGIDDDPFAGNLDSPKA